MVSLMRNSANTKFLLPNDQMMLCFFSYMDVDGTSKFNEIDVSGFYSF